MAFSTGGMVPSGNFNLFVHYDHRQRLAAVRIEGVEIAPERRRTQAPADAAPNGAVDFTPTGTVATAARSRPDRPLLDFDLRDVVDGKALVASRASMSLVGPGSVLAGAGEVLSIERRDGRWVLVIADGIIAARPR